MVGGDYLYHGDMEHISNWKPISLLNYDNEIFTKTLATTIQISLEDIIDSEQTAAIQERTIIENLQLNLIRMNLRILPWSFYMRICDAQLRDGFTLSCTPFFCTHSLILHIVFLFCLEHLCFLPMSPISLVRWQISFYTQNTKVQSLCYHYHWEHYL